MVTQINLPNKNSKPIKKGIIFYLRTFAMIKPDCVKNMGNIINIIERSGFLISRLKMVRFSRD